MQSTNNFASWNDDTTCRVAVIKSGKVVVVSILNGQVVSEVPLPIFVPVTSLAHDGASLSIIVGLTNGKILSLCLSEINKWCSMQGDVQENENVELFTTLLKDQKSEQEYGRSIINQDLCTISNRLLGTVLPSFTLVSAFLCCSLLIALAFNTDSHTYCLLRWAADKTVPVLPFVTDISITCDEAETESGSLLYRVPFLVAFAAPSGRSCSQQLALLTREFFTIMFGPEKALSFSYILMLGSQTGHVFYCDLKRVCGDTKSRCDTEVLCCLEQPVLFMSQFCGTSSHDMDGFLFLGVGGKIILCVKGDCKQVIFKQFSLLGPISSALFLNKIGLIYSTRSSVELVCLKPSCLSLSEGKVSSHFSPIEAVFDSPVTISCGPLTLFHFVESTLPHDEKPSLQLVAVDPEGEVSLVSMHAHLSPVSDTIHNHMPIEVCKTKLQDMLKTIALYETSCNKVMEEIELVHSVIQNIGSAISLFSSIATRGSSLSGSIPFKCKAKMLFPANEVGIGQSQQLLNFCIHYCGCTPLGNSWSVVLLVRDNEHQESFSATADISGLGVGRRVNLNYPVPHSMLFLDHIVVDCLLHFNPHLHAIPRWNTFGKWCGVSVQLDSVCVTMQSTD